jgi:hypothetical protein
VLTCNVASAVRPHTPPSRTGMLKAGGRRQRVERSRRFGDHPFRYEDCRQSKSFRGWIHCAYLPFLPSTKRHYQFYPRLALRAYRPVPVLQPILGRRLFVWQASHGQITSSPRCDRKPVAVHGVKYNPPARCNRFLKGCLTVY